MSNGIFNNKLITQTTEWHSNMTTLNHLGRALIAKPTIVGPNMDRLFTSQDFYSDNPLQKNLLGNKMTEMKIDGLSWEYSLRVANTKPSAVIENMLPSTVTHPGRYRTSIPIKLEDNPFKPGDIITPGTGEKIYQCRIQSDAVRHGEGYLYELQPVTDNPNHFIPTKFFKSGTLWVKLFTAYEEGSEQGGSTTFSTPISFQNSLGKMRKSYSITDYASTEVLCVKILDSKGKAHDTWIRYAEVEYWQQWYREYERNLWYGRTSRGIKGSTGREVRTFPGVQEQLEYSNVSRYSHLTTKFLDEYLMDIYYGRTKPGSGKAVKGFTGEYGMSRVSDVMEDWMKRRGLVLNVESFIKKEKSDYHTNALGAGYQFVKYYLKNGSTLELIHNPLYDDREINLEIDPITGYPIESQRITFLDFSGDYKGGNIKIVKKNNGFAFNYIEGMYSPYGPNIRSASASHAGEYYSMEVSDNLGVHIGDPSKCGELILTRA